MGWFQKIRIRLWRRCWNREAEALLSEMDYHRRAEILHREALRTTWARWRALQKKINPADKVIVHLASPEQAARLARKVIRLHPLERS